MAQSPIRYSGAEAGGYELELVLFTLPIQHGLKSISCWRFSRRELFDISAKRGVVHLGKDLCLYNPAKCITSIVK